MTLVHLLLFLGDVIVWGGGAFLVLALVAAPFVYLTEVIATPGYWENRRRRVAEAEARRIEAGGLSNRQAVRWILWWWAAWGGFMAFVLVCSYLSK